MEAHAVPIASMRPRQSSLGNPMSFAMSLEQERHARASMRPRQSSLGNLAPILMEGAAGQAGFNEAEAIKPRKLGTA